MAYTTRPYEPLIKRINASVLTRPANTTAYAAGDVVGTASTGVLTLNGAAKSNSGGGRILGVRLNKSGTTVTNATFTVHFYNTAPTAVADNAAWDSLYAEAEYYIGSTALTLMTAGGAGGGFTSLVVNPPLWYQTASGSKALYAVITAAAAYTPASAETFKLSVTVEQVS
jgi:hypothetical protein